MLQELFEINLDKFFKKGSSELFHYTDCNGLIGIIESGKLRMTERDYLNDMYERKHANKVLSNINIDVDKLEEYKDYIFSSSMEGDKSNQWAYYGGESGYCIVFNREKLSSFFESHRRETQEDSHKSESLFFGPIIYDDNTQKNIAQTIERLLVEHPEIRGSYESFMYYSLVHSLLKHKNNYTEEEFRFIITQRNMTPNFSNRNGLVRPYIDFPENPERLLPITEIIVGPNIYDDKAIDGIRLLLKSKGYPESIKVYKSESKVRK